VTRSGCRLLAAAAASTAVAGCLLYTDQVNHPPTIVDLSGPVRVNRGDSAPFDATADDEDQTADSLILEWRAQPGACPPLGAAPDAIPPAMAGPAATNRSYVLKNVTDATCVWVVARDDRGAVAWKGKVVEANHPPEAVIDVVTGKMVAGDAFELYSTVQLTGTRSTDADNDVVTIIGWSLTSPDLVTRPPEACPSAKDDACVLLDRPGAYVLELAVRDSQGGEGRAKRTLMVADDRPPCVETTMPDFRIGTIPHQSSQPLHFELSVASDDGDPYPGAADRAMLIWEWRFDGDPAWLRQKVIPYAGLDFPPSALAAHAGRSLAVRLSYLDRVMRDLSRCTEASCELGPTVADAHCYQRVGWTVQIF
jgi:hypothetical protein